MTEITDEYMQEQLSKTKAYALVLLKSGPNYEVHLMRSFPGSALP